MRYNQSSDFTIGVEELNYLTGRIIPPYTILVAGHPGAGKTTLGATICYSNAVRGKKCLYVSFYEEKDKLYAYMERLGIKLRDAESRGLLKFLRLPATMDAENLANTLSKTIMEGFQVVVIDSITVLLESLRENVEKRAWLLNYFYQLPSVFNGLLVLISELPFGDEKLTPLPAEFVSDAIFVLKHKIEDRYLVRLLEIRKARGAPVHIAEVPFVIMENKGIVLHVQPVLEDIRESLEEVELPCRILQEKLKHLHRGFVINVFYPPDTVYGRDVLAFLLALAVKHDFKMLFLSYISSPNTIRDDVVNIVAKSGLSRDIAEKLVDEYIVFRAINPFAYSLSELSMREEELINSVDPDIIVFHGVHVSSSIHEAHTYFKELYRQVVYFKQKGKIVVRIGSCVDELSCNLQSSIADTTIKVTRIFVENKYITLVQIFRRFVEPEVVSTSELGDCLMECLEVIKKRAIELYSGN
ncbi:MAG: ATPase domain-containing protein [Desulfurococcaceae archaeon]